MLTLAKYSIGVGDRFAHQARAQLRACMLAAEHGADVIPVWNKSHREHTTVGSKPDSIRAAADAAVKSLGWKKPYHVDADHIRLETVDGFLAASDFYTIDVADAIGQPADPAAVAAFVKRHPELADTLKIPGIETPLTPTKADVERIAGKYLRAVQQAGAIARHIRERKKDECILEVSMDETDFPQTPPELLVILAALADEKIPLQTIAPKFTGRFNKGVDYVGDIVQFEKEFSDDLAVIAYAIGRYGLPANLKLSVHSGSDKFSIYAPIRRSIAKFGAGLHLKTAGTTWLGEVIGLAEAGGDGLRDRQARSTPRRSAESRGPIAAPIRRSHRHRPGEAAEPGDGQHMVVRRVRRGAAARSEVSGVQPGAAATDPRRLQDRGDDGRSLPRFVEILRGDDREERDGEPVRSTPEAAVR